MDAYHAQHRFPGSGETPPPPQASYPNAQWYPVPPTPYPPYPPHPPHPPPQDHQWGPPPAVQHHPPQQPYAYQPPPPPQQQPYTYQPPPPAPGNPWPPHHVAGQPPPPAYPPPPPGQARTNLSWAPNPVYPDRGPLASPGKNYGSFPSTYEQEVSYKYSTAPGSGNVMLQYPSSQAQPFPTTASVQDGFPQAPLSMPITSTKQPPFVHEQHSVDPSDQPLEFNSRKAPDMPIHTTVASNHDAVVASTHSWMPSVTLGFHPVPSQAAQMDPSVHAAPLFGAISGPNYVPPAAFGVGNVTEVFPTDPNTPFNAAEKSKKPPVPNWLREELLKKKSAPLSAPTQHMPHLDSMESNGSEQQLRRPDQSDSKSNDSAKSTEDDEDDEDEIEAARTAAINQEIKCMLTEVLLKVTDDLFDEIATKFLNEDDSSAEFNEHAGVSSLKEPGESKNKMPATVVLPAKPPNISFTDHRDSSELNSHKGALLGLANYSSDEDDSVDGYDKALSNLSSETNATANHEKMSAHGSTSLGDVVKSVDKRTQQRANAEPEHKHIHDTQNGEFPIDAKTSQPKDIHKMDEKAYKHLEKSSKGTLFKEDKADHTIELESSIGGKYDNDDKCSIYDKKGSIKENKGSDRIAKHESDTGEPRSKVDSKHDDVRGNRKDMRKDTRVRKRDSTDARGSRGKDEKQDRSRQMIKSSTSHNSRRSRSRSQKGRSRTRKESFSHGRGSASSDERSDNMRKLHSHKKSMSPSPPKFRNRCISRSPHSKRSHRRHSPYSSADRKRRSRSRTPVKRR